MSNKESELFIDVLLATGLASLFWGVLFVITIGEQLLLTHYVFICFLVMYIVFVCFLLLNVYRGNQLGRIRLITILMITVTLAIYAIVKIVQIPLSFFGLFLFACGALSIVICFFDSFTQNTYRNN